MKQLLLTALLVGAMPAVFAQTGTSEPVTASNNARNDEAGEPLSDRNCLRETGSRIVARQNAKGQKRCTGMPGHAYTREDLDRTGQINTADALRTLDASVY